MKSKKTYLFVVWLRKVFVKTIVNLLCQGSVVNHLLTKSRVGIRPCFQVTYSIGNYVECLNIFFSGNQSKTREDTFENEHDIDVNSEVSKQSSRHSKHSHRHHRHRHTRESHTREHKRKKKRKKRSRLNEDTEGQEGILSGKYCN